MSKKNCNPNPKVRKAASKLSTSKSAAVRSKSGKVLREHQIKNH